MKELSQPSSQFDLHFPFNQFFHYFKINYTRIIKQLMAKIQAFKIPKWTSHQSLPATTKMPWACIDERSYDGQMGPSISQYHLVIIEL